MKHGQSGIHQWRDLQVMCGVGLMVLSSQIQKWNLSHVSLLDKIQDEVDEIHCNWHRRKEQRKMHKMTGPDETN